jgi:AcrR family transcriptional regulator
MSYSIVDPYLRRPLLSDPSTKPALVTTSETIHKRVADNKRRVCEVAARQFNTNSYDAASIESIATEAGIARSTFYRFFSDKEDVVKEMINPVFYQARTQLEALDPEKPEEIVNGIADCYLAVWKDQRDALLFSVNIGMMLFPLVQDAHNAYADVVLQLMKRVHEARLLRHDDPSLAAVMVAQTAVRILQVCERHPQFENVFRSTLRGMLLKW